MKIMTFLAVSAAISLPAGAFASDWQLDPDHSNVGFQVRHLMVSNVKGSFGKVDGVINVDEKDITKTKVNVTIGTDSITTGNAKRDEHLKSADFFEVAKYPTMTFVSKKVIKGSKGKFKLLGDLTIHGVTKEAVLDVEGFDQEAKDPWGNTRRGASATAKISRKDFGLTWNKALETGGVMISDDVGINLAIEAIKQKAQ